MRSLASDFNNKKQELESSNKNYATNLASQKTYIKPEPATKKPKVSQNIPKKSVFAGTSLDTSLTSNASDSALSSIDYSSEVINDSGFSSVSSI
jgi:hypothetical protein